MNAILEIHLGFAFFVFLLALFIGWVQLGRRTLVVVIGLQILIGAIVAAIAGATRRPLPGTLWVHIAGALLALAAYVVSRRMLDRNPALRIPALAISLLGLIFVIFTIWYGSHLTMTHGI